MTKVAFVLEQVLYDSVKHSAKLQGITPGEWMRRAVSHYFGDLDVIHAQRVETRNVALSDHTPAECGRDQGGCSKHGWAGWP